MTTSLGKVLSRECHGGLIVVDDPVRHTATMKPMMTTQTAHDATAPKRASRARGASHDAIVDVAARLFRERGFVGVGVDEVMSGAGLTHGGFYSHFGNKTALIEEAIARAFDENRRMMLVVPADPAAPPRREIIGDEWFVAVRKRYLGRGHLEAAGAGCAIPALAGDVSRGSVEVRAAFTRSFQAIFALFEERMASSSLPPAEARRFMLASLTQWIGAITLARAVNDDALADEILSTAMQATQLPSTAPTAVAATTTTTTA